MIVDHVIVFSVDLPAHEPESQLLQYIKSKQPSLTGTLRSMFAHSLCNDILFTVIIIIGVGKGLGRIFCVLLACTNSLFGYGKWRKPKKRTAIRGQNRKETAITHKAFSPNVQILGWIWGFHGGGYDEYHLLGYYAV
jgi:hypothetical protein